MLSPAFFFKLFLFACTLSPAFLQSEKIKQTPHVQCSPDSQMTQGCFDLKVRLLLSFKGQTFISARSAEGCGEELIPSVSGADLDFPLQSLTVSLLLKGLFSKAALRPCHKMVDPPALYRFSPSSISPMRLHCCEASAEVPPECSHKGKWKGFAFFYHHTA